MGWCVQAIRSYRGPLIAIALGIGFMVVGAVPVAVTFSLNSKSSATIIGVGFIGFGLLLILPGVGWCLVRRASSFRCCRSHTERLRPDDEYAADDDLERSQTSPSVTSVQPPRASYILTTDQIIKSAAFFDVIDDKPTSHANDDDSTRLEEQETEADEDIVNPDDGDVRLTR